MWRAVMPREPSTSPGHQHSRVRSVAISACASTQQPVRVPRPHLRHKLVAVCEHDEGIDSHTRSCLSAVAEGEVVQDVLLALQHDSSGRDDTHG